MRDNISKTDSPEALPDFGLPPFFTASFEHGNQKARKKGNKHHACGRMAGEPSRLVNGAAGCRMNASGKIWLPETISISRPNEVASAALQEHVCRQARDRSSRSPFGAVTPRKARCPFCEYVKKTLSQFAHSLSCVLIILLHSPMPRASPSCICVTGPTPSVSEVTIAVHCGPSHPVLDL